VTVEEELDKLEDDIRRLKIEYEVYLNGGSKRPPRDSVFRVESVIKRYANEQSELSFSQRFRFNTLVQKYAVNHELWNRKLLEKEEGRGRFAVQKQREAESTADRSVRVVFSDPEKEPESLGRLLQAIVEARQQVGERVDNIDPKGFQKYIREKTKQIQQSLGCQKVQFSVLVEDGKVKFKAAKVA
jgi:hypothetical protein